MLLIKIKFLRQVKLQFCGLALLLICPLSHATTYFESCESALKKPTFHRLGLYLKANQQLLVPTDPDSRPYTCMALNSHQFLVIADILSTGGGASDGTYFCDFSRRQRASTNIAKCMEVGGPIYPPEVVKEFNDGRGKHFVLFVAAGLPSGILSQEYLAFYLTTPNKATDGQPFIMQSLFEVQSDGGNVPGEEKDPIKRLCKPRLDLQLENLHPAGDFDTTNITPVIGQNATGYAHLQFLSTQKDCHSHQLTQLRREFVFQHGKFVEIPSRPPSQH